MSGMVFILPAEVAQHLLSLSSLYLYTQPCQLAFRRRVEYKYTSVGTHFGLEINDISFLT